MFFLGEWLTLLVNRYSACSRDAKISFNVNQVFQWVFVQTDRYCQVWGIPLLSRSLLSTGPATAEVRRTIDTFWRQNLSHTLRCHISQSIQNSWPSSSYLLCTISPSLPLSQSSFILLSMQFC